jgi:FkbH-like protein
LQLPADPAGFRGALQSLEWFDTLTLTKEDQRRSEMYQRESQRQQLREKSQTLEGYLRSLEMIVEIGAADAFSVPRIAQLTQKTNQFNLTTRRYTDDDIRLMAEDPRTDVFYASVRDRFDDSGIIAVAIVQYESERARIDTLLMSCRVIGRGIEQTLLAAIFQAARNRHCLSVEGEYIPTAKNALVKDLYSQNGFTPVDRPERSLWQRELSLPLLAHPDWFQEVKIRWR